MSTKVRCPACSKEIAVKGIPLHTAKCPQWTSHIGVSPSEFNFAQHFKRGLYGENQKEGVDYCVCQLCLEEGVSCRRKTLKKHLDKVHNTTVDVYLEKFPRSPVRLQSTVTKRIATTREMYGVDNVFQSEGIKEKSRKTMVSRYGVEHCSHAESVRKKTAATNMSRYGHVNVFGSPEIQERARKSMLERHGVTNPQKSKVIQERTQRTNRERYGASYFFLSSSFLHTQNLERLERAKDRRERLKASGKFEICPHCDEIFTTLTSRHKAICEGWPDTVVPEPCLCGHESTSRTQMKRHLAICKEWQGRDANAVARARKCRTWLKTLGVENPLQNDQVKAKVVATNMERYGAPSPFHKDSSLYESIRKSLVGVDQAVRGEKNAFSKPWIKERVIRTCLPKVGVDLSNYDKEVTTIEELQDRYGLVSPMQNRDWSLHMLDSQGHTNGPNMLEASFHEANPELIYTGDLSFWRWLPRLQRHKNPDFLVPGPDPEHPRRDLCKVIEVFGDYWHSKKFTGQDPVEHCRELVESYADVGIRCLIVWEKDIRRNLNNVRDVVLDFLSI